MSHYIGNLSISEWNDVRIPILRHRQLADARRNPRKGGVRIIKNAKKNNRFDSENRAPRKLEDL